MDGAPRSGRLPRLPDLSFARAIVLIRSLTTFYILILSSNSGSRQKSEAPARIGLALDQIYAEGEGHAQDRERRGWDLS